MRITGGQFRGRNLEGPRDRNIRPTTDKIRQAIFNMLTHGTWRMEWGVELDNVRVLDLFCGTGSLGLEAISHGASFAHFIDSEETALKIAQGNAKTLRLNREVKFTLGQADRLKKNNEEPYGLVFLDPPYHQNLVQPCLETLRDGGWLRQASILVVEQEKGAILSLPQGYQDIVTRSYGGTEIVLLGYDREAR